MFAAAPGASPWAAAPGGEPADPATAPGSRDSPAATPPGRAAAPPCSFSAALLSSATLASSHASLLLIVSWSSAGSLSIASARCSRRSNSRPSPLAGTGSDNSSLATSAAASPFAGDPRAARPPSPAVAGARCGGTAAAARGASGSDPRVLSTCADAFAATVLRAGAAAPAPPAVGSASRIVYSLLADEAHSERTARRTAGSAIAARETMLKRPCPPSRR